MKKKTKQLWIYNFHSLTVHVKENATPRLKQIQISAGDLIPISSRNICVSADRSLYFIQNREAVDAPPLEGPWQGDWTGWVLWALSVQTFWWGFVLEGICFVLVRETQRQAQRTPQTAVYYGRVIIILSGATQESSTSKLSQLKAWVTLPFFPTWREQELLPESSRNSPEQTGQMDGDTRWNCLNMDDSALKKTSIKKRTFRAAYKWSNETSFSSVK